MWDSTGKWLYGYARKLGSCDAIHAEMWDMWVGISLTRQRGITKLVVESDSKTLVDMLAYDGGDNSDHYLLVKRIKKLLSGTWDIQAMHTWREGNSCAD